jgi:predicted DNA-binding transcriptional regulator AlpA
MPKNKHEHVNAYDTDDCILSTEELLKRIPLTRVTLWRMSREGRFVKPIQLTKSRIGWRWSAVLRWMADREKHPVKSREYFGRGKESDDAA